MKVEILGKAQRKLNQMVGTTLISSSEETDPDPDHIELSPKTHEVEQNDFEFGAEFNYTTNVSVQFHFIAI